MTDEMRVALVAVASARGMRPAYAWDAIEALEHDGLSARELVEAVDRLAVGDQFPAGVS